MGCAKIMCYGIYSLIENDPSRTLVVSGKIRHHTAQYIREVSRKPYCSKFADILWMNRISGDYWWLLKLELFWSQYQTWAYVP